MTVMCVQLLCVLYMYSLRLSPQCHAFLYFRMITLWVLWMYVGLVGNFQLVEEAK